MPRRPPPSPLMLYTGPTPSRTRPKHTLPSLPRPTFYPFKAAPLPAPTSIRPHVFGLSIPTPAVLPSVGSLPPSPEVRTKSPLRGPWDHSRSLSESTVDVDSLVRMPKPAAVTISPLSSSVW